MTKLPEELHHILGEVAHPCPAFCGFGELGSYVIGLIHSLACAERAFDFIPLFHGPGHRGLPLWAWRILGRSSEGFGVAFDFKVFQYGTVVLVHVDLVGKDGGGQAAETLLVLVDVQLHVASLMIGIPAVVVDEVVPLDDAHAYLAAELCLRRSLSADDGAQVRLEDADDAVVASVFLRLVHLLLLEIHLHGGVQDALLVLAQILEAVAELTRSDVHQGKDVLMQAGQHNLYGVPHQLAALLLHLHEILVGFPRLEAVGPGCFYARHLADAADEAVHDTAPIIDDVHVHGIAHLCIGTRGVNLQDSLVQTVIAVGESGGILIHLRRGWRLLAAVLGFLFLTLAHFFLHLLLTQEQDFRHLIDVILADALAKVDEKGRVEYRLVGELHETAEVLHVGILPYHLNGVNVGHACDMLDEHGGYHHTGRLGTGSGLLVVELQTIPFPIHVPRKMVPQPHPAVPLVKSVERRLENIDGQLLVTWFEFHLLASFNTQRYALFVK